MYINKYIIESLGKQLHLYGSSHPQELFINDDEFFVFKLRFKVSWIIKCIFFISSLKSVGIAV